MQINRRTLRTVLYVAVPFPLCPNELKNSRPALQSTSSCLQRWSLWRARSIPELAPDQEQVVVAGPCQWSRPLQGESTIWVCRITSSPDRVAGLDIMTSRIEARIATLFVLACIVSCVAGTLEDGLPRPANFADAPTISYGAEPKLTNDAGAPADCAWYGFSNLLYPESTTSVCQTTLRTALTNETANPATELHPYVYYTLVRLIDPATNESYCYQGCFKWDSAMSPVYAPGPSYFRGPAPAPMYLDGPVMAPMYYGPSMAPLSDSPYTSPGGAPAMSPGN